MALDWPGSQRHSRYLTFHYADVAISRRLFGEILRLIDGYVDSACDSTWLLRIWDEVTAHLERYRRIALRRNTDAWQRRTRHQVERRAIMQAVLVREFERSANLLTLHQRQTEKREGPG